MRFGTYKRSSKRSRLGNKIKTGENTKKGPTYGHPNADTFVASQYNTITTYIWGIRDKEKKEKKEKWGLGGVCMVCMYERSIWNKWKMMANERRKSVSFFFETRVETE